MPFSVHWPCPAVPWFYGKRITVTITDPVYPLWGNNYSVLVSLQRILPSTEDFTREQIGRAEIPIFKFHCLLNAMSKYCFIWMSHFSLVLSHIWGALKLQLVGWMAVWQVRLPAIPQGPSQHSHAPSLCSSDFLSWSSSLLQMSSLATQKLQQWVNSCSPSSETIQTSRILEFKGDSWFLHQVTHNTVHVFKWDKNPLRSLLKRLRRFCGHQIVFKEQYFDVLIIRK